MSEQKLVGLPAPVSYGVYPLLPVNPLTLLVLEPFSNPINTVTITLTQSKQKPRKPYDLTDFTVSKPTVSFTPGEWATVLYRLDQHSASHGYYISGYFPKTVWPDRRGQSNLPLPVPPQRGLFPAAASKNYTRGHASQYMVGQACTDGTSYAIANFNPMKESPDALQRAELDIILIVSSINDPKCRQWLVDPQDNDVGSTGDPDKHKDPGWPVNWLPRGA